MSNSMFFSSEAAAQKQELGNQVWNWATPQLPNIQASLCQIL